MEREEVVKYLRMREGGHVQRCHCFPHHGSYDVAQHCYHMALLLKFLHPHATARLYEAILLHDVFERWMGDAPAAVKRLYAGLHEAKRSMEKYLSNRTGILLLELRTDEAAWLKALDNIEFLLWCDDQAALGNRNVDDKRDEVKAWLKENWRSIPNPCQDFLEAYRWERTKDDLG